jgi:hypothetical protein
MAMAPLLTQMGDKLPYCWAATQCPREGLLKSLISSSFSVPIQLPPHIAPQVETHTNNFSDEDPMDSLFLATKCGKVHFLSFKSTS